MGDEEDTGASLARSLEGLVSARCSQDGPAPLANALRCGLQAVASPGTWQQEAFPCKKKAGVALQEILAAKRSVVGKDCDLHSWGNPLVMAPQARTTHLYPSPTSLQAVCTPQEAIRGAGDQADPCGRGERAHPEPSSQLEGAKVSTCSSTHLT